MANEEHLEILKQGFMVWNNWRTENPSIRPDLSMSELEKADLRGVNLSRTDLNKSNLKGASFHYSDLTYSNLSEASLDEASLVHTNFSKANVAKSFLFKSHIEEVDFTGAKLVETRINEAILRSANFDGADFTEATLTNSSIISSSFRSANLHDVSIFGCDIYGSDFSNATLTNGDLRFSTLRSTLFNNANLAFVRLSLTTFADIDLSMALGLENVRHNGPSTLGIDTIYKSGGKIPEEFLRGCGVPEGLITFLPSIIGAQEAIQFYSCFISYSTKDEEFARRLYSRMRDEKLRVWFAPEDMKGGALLHEQIEQAIQLHDRLLVVLSEESMASDWVKREIRNARRAEKREDRRKLFPIRVVDYKAIENWKGFEGDEAEDLAFELGKFYIPDFSNWKTDHDAFEREFAKLLRDLRAEEGK